jgi:hypothetical protein
MEQYVDASFGIVANGFLDSRDQRNLSSFVHLLLE